MKALDFYLCALICHYLLSETGVQRETTDIYYFVRNSIDPKTLELIGLPEEEALDRLDNLLYRERLADELSKRSNDGTLDNLVPRYQAFRQQFEGGARYLLFLYVDLPWYAGWQVTSDELLFEGPPLLPSRTGSTIHSQGNNRPQFFTVC